MLFARLIVIAAASAAALLAAGIVLAFGTAMSESDLTLIERIEFFGAAYFATGYGPAIALVLSVTAVVLAEARNIRSVLYYVIAGALIGFVSSWSVDLSPALENTTDIAPITLAKTIATFAGMVGGLVYWAIASRRAAKAV